MTFYNLCRWLKVFVVFWHVSVSSFFPFGKVVCLKVTWVILWIIRRFLFLFLNICRTLWVSPVAQWVKNPSAVQKTQEMQAWSLGQENPLKEENGNLLQYSCLKNPMDRGAWRATVHQFTKSQTRWASRQTPPEAEAETQQGTGIQIISARICITHIREL